MTQPFEIAHLADGGVAATNGASHVSVEPGGRIFRRRAVLRAGSPQAQQVEWAVAELDGVRAYFDGQNVIVSKRDLMP